MDEARYEWLTKGLATRRTRREAARLLAGSSLAAMIAAGSPRVSALTVAQEASPAAGPDGLDFNELSISFDQDGF